MLIKWKNLKNMGTYGGFVPMGSYTRLSRLPTAMSRNHPKARLMCMKPSKRFRLKIFRCNRLSRITSQVAGRSLKLKKPFLTFDRSVTFRFRYQDAYLKARNPSRNIMPHENGNTNKSNFMAGYFFYSKLHQVNNVAGIYTTRARIQTFTTKPAPINSFR